MKKGYNPAVNYNTNTNLAYEEGVFCLPEEIVLIHNHVTYLEDSFYDAQRYCRSIERQLSSRWTVCTHSECVNTSEKLDSYILAQTKTQGKIRIDYFKTIRYLEAVNLI